MEIQLGRPVMSSDGEHVGKVDRLVLDPDTKHIVEIIVHEGFLLTKDRIVEEGFIAGVDDDGTVRLTKPAAEVDELPLFVKHSYVSPSAAEVQDLPYPISGGVAAAGEVMPLLWRSSYSGEAYRSVGRSLLESAPVDVAPMVIESNIPAELLSLDTGTAVLDSAGVSIGHVEDVDYDDEGRLTGFVVRSGLLRHHETRVSIDQVDRLLGSEIRLKMTADELEG